MNNSSTTVRSLSSRREGETDWKKVDNLTDEEITEAVRQDPDAVLLNKQWFEMAELMSQSRGKEKVTIRLDEDVVEWFRGEGSGYQTRINEVLKAYMISRRMRDKNSSST